MKLIVTGATGLVGTEVIRQALSMPSVTSVIALARREVKASEDLAPDADKSKLKSVILDDFENYTPEVKEQIKGADACIWLLAITPSKSKAFAPEQVRKVCLDYTVAGIREISSVANKPFRFIYTSGAMAERDQSNKNLWLIPEYRRMRGECENCVLAFASQSSGTVEAQITRPGGIVGPKPRIAMLAAAAVVGVTPLPPFAHVSEVSGAMLQQVVEGFEKETLDAADLVRIGQRVVKKEDYVK